MWKKTDRGLVQTIDESRVKFRVRINVDDLKQLKEWSDQYDTNISYLIEDGLTRMFKDESMVIEGSTRSKGNVEVGLWIDDGLAGSIHKIIDNNKKIKMTMVIKCCMPYIKPEEAKKDSWKHRVVD